jgi:glycine dehydrogenase
MKLNIDYQEKFQSRHIAPNQTDTEQMLKVIGVNSLDELIEQTIPKNIRLKAPLNLPAAKSEFDCFKKQSIQIIYRTRLL